MRVRFGQGGVSWSVGTVLVVWYLGGAVDILGIIVVVLVGGGWYVDL